MCRPLPSRLIGFLVAQDAEHILQGSNPPALASARVATVRLFWVSKALPPVFLPFRHLLLSTLDDIDLTREHRRCAGAD